MLVENAYAKINLFLHVTGRRADGYHTLESGVAFVALSGPIPGDRLALMSQESQEPTLDIEGPFAASLQESLTASPQHNLILKAVALFLEHYREMGELPPEKFRLHLWKALPIAAGIGGGSADAAACLRLLNCYFGAPFSKHQLADMGMKLGADVPMCVYQQPAWIGGVGEQWVPLPFSPQGYIVLVNPGVPLLTKDVFATYGTLQGKGQQSFSKAEGPDPFIQFTASQEKDFWQEITARHNDLEASAQIHCPLVGSILASLRVSAGCRFARMSGSGPTCFGIFDTEIHAQQACAQLKQRYPWVTYGRLFSAL